MGGPLLHGKGWLAPFVGEGVEVAQFEGGLDALEEDVVQGRGAGRR